jgi:hypothetical protein
MSTRMRPIKVIARGEDYPFPIGWDADKAEKRIRNEFELSGGGLRCSGVPLSDEDKIGDAVGELTFVGAETYHHIQRLRQ